jgi:hypothetical protein
MVIPMTYTSWDKQISNRNFLSASGFKFTLAKKPKVDFFCNSAAIPGLNLGSAIQPSYLKNIPIPGDVLSYDDLTLSFNVDEDLENYLEIHNWLIQFGFPDNLGQYQELLNEDKNSEGIQNAMSGMSDGTLIVYSSNYNPTLKVNFKDLYPTSLSALSFNSSNTDINYVTCEVTFKYTIYKITKVKK